jgi:hypothetical protein
MNNWYGEAQEEEMSMGKERMFWDVGWGYGEVFYGPVCGA